MNPFINLVESAIDRALETRLGRAVLWIGIATVVVLSLIGAVAVALILSAD